MPSAIPQVSVVIHICMSSVAMPNKTPEPMTVGRLSSAIAGDVSWSRMSQLGMLANYRRAVSFGLFAFLFIRQILGDGVRVAVEKRHDLLGARMPAVAVHDEFLAFKPNSRHRVVERSCLAEFQPFEFSGFPSPAAVWIVELAATFTGSATASAVATESFSE